MPRGALVEPGPGWLATVQAEVSRGEVPLAEVRLAGGRSRSRGSSPPGEHMFLLPGVRVSPAGLGRADSRWLVSCGRRCPGWADGRHLHVVGLDEARRLRRGFVLAHLRWWLGVPLLLYLGVVALLLLAGVGTAAAAPSGPTHSWTWPIEGSPEVGREFAPPAEKYGRGHRGVDLRATPGAPVLAAGAGRVSYAGMLAGRGVVVVVHGELRTTYEPVTASVAVGQAVAAGEPIGTLEAGHAGCPVAGCLHWGLRRGDAYLDPVALVADGPPRLLPLDDPMQRTDAAGVPPAPVAEPVAVEPPAATAAEATADVTPTDTETGEWALRSAVTPAGAAALAALVVGLGLLARTRTPPGGPPAATAAASVERREELAGLVDLDAERRRRREVA